MCQTCTTADECLTNEYLAGSCSGSNNTYCASCYNLCGSCIGPGPNNCSSCAGFGELQIVDSVNQVGYCLANCPAGEYPTSGKCASCSSSCKTCITAGTCTSCGGSLNLYKGQCVASCPAGYFAVNNTCEQCTTCSSGNWAYVPCSATADAKCKPWTVCTTGQAQTTAGNATNDRVCNWVCERGRG